MLSPGDAVVYTPYDGAAAEDGVVTDDRPCGACPWVSREPRDREAIAKPETQAAMKAGAWFCCHVDLGTCHGARLRHEQHLRRAEPASG